MTVLAVLAAPGCEDGGAGAPATTEPTTSTAITADPAPTTGTTGRATTPTPSSAVPTTVAPDDARSRDTAPDDATSDDATPDDATPDDAAPDDAAPDDSAPGTAPEPAAGVVPPEGGSLVPGVPADERPEVLGPLGSSVVELETEDGTIQIGTGEVPGLVADDFPVPDDLEVQLASDLDDQAGFSGVSRLDFDDLVELYRTGLPAAGFEAEEERLVDGRLALFGFAGAEGDGQVAISSAPGGGWSVLVTYRR